MKSYALGSLFVASLAAASIIGSGGASAISTTDRIAIINADGSREFSFGMVSSARLGLGTYDLRWNRDITRCSAVIIPGSPTSFGAPTAFANAVQRAGSAGVGHFITIHDAAGALVDSEFMIMVACV